MQPDSVTFKNKVARFAWDIVWAVLFRPSPRAFHAWRLMLLRIFGAQVGQRVRVYQTTRIWAPWKLSLADDSCLGDHVDCYCVAAISLDKNAVVSQYTHLCTASHQYDDPANRLISAPITIGRFAWITAGVFVAPGVDIGEGAVIQARSVVLADIAPWTVAGGHPAKALKKRGKEAFLSQLSED